jgi:small subunit ribosomal protein S17
MTTEVKRKKSLRKIEGRVVSNKMNKTIVVEASTLVRHPKYGKYFKRYKKFKAHDESQTCGIGDRVEIIECRPLSKQKRFRLSLVIEKAKRLETTLDEAVAG